MTYRIAGLPRTMFSEYLGRTDRELAQMRARRVIADADRGFPCRVSLEDARAGDSLILLHFVSHETENPYRTAFAIYVREDASEPEPFVDTIPPVMRGRDLSLRGFGADGLLVVARLVPASEGEAVDTAIQTMFADPAIASIHVHNAAYGCFAARVERDGEAK